MAHRSFSTVVFIPLLLLVGVILFISDTPTKQPVVPVAPPTIVKPIERPKLLVFEATWCGACHSISDKINQIEASGIKVTRIDADQHPELLAKYGVTSLPTMFVIIGEDTKRTQSIDEVLRLLDAAKER